MMDTLADRTFNGLICRAIHLSLPPFLIAQLVWTQLSTLFPEKNGSQTWCLTSVFKTQLIFFLQFPAQPELLF